MSLIGNSEATARLHARVLTFTEANGYVFVTGATKSNGKGVMFKVTNVTDPENPVTTRHISPDPNDGSGTNWDTHVVISEVQWGLMSLQYTI